MNRSGNTANGRDLTPIGGPVHEHGIGVFIDWDERRKWQNPDSILASIPLRQGDVFFDVGCGDGFFSIPAARIVGACGKVYALDVSPEAIDRLRGKAAREILDNIETLAGEAEELLPCSSCVDVTFFGIVLHDFKDPAAVLANAYSALKPGGTVIDLDWKKMKMEIGPPEAVRLSEEHASGLLEAAGFEIVSVEPLGSFDYIITARK